MKKERKDRSESPLIQVKKKQAFSPSREKAYYSRAQEPSEEGETSEVSETTSEEYHEDDAEKRRRRNKQ